MFPKYGKKIVMLSIITDLINIISGTLGATIYSVWHTIGTVAMTYGDSVVVIKSAVNTLICLICRLKNIIIHKYKKRLAKSKEKCYIINVQLNTVTETSRVYCLIRETSP